MSQVPASRDSYIYQTTLDAVSLTYSFLGPRYKPVGQSSPPATPHPTTTKQIDDIRYSVLRLPHAFSAQFNIVFCANTTARINLALEAFTAQMDGSWWRHYVNPFRGLFRARDLTSKTTYSPTNAEMEVWLGGLLYVEHSLGLCACLAESKFSGYGYQRIGLRDCEIIS